MDGWMGGRTDGRTDGWMDGWLAGCIHGTHTHTHVIHAENWLFMDAGLQTPLDLLQKAYGGKMRDQAGLGRRIPAGPTVIPETDIHGCIYAWWLPAIP